MLFRSNAKCAAYKPDAFRSLYRVGINAIRPARSIMATVNIVESTSLVSPDEIGLSANAFSALGVEEGTPVTLALDKALGDATNDALALQTRQAPQLATAAVSLVATAALSTAPVLVSAPVSIVTLGLPMLGLTPYLPKQKEQ